MSKLNSFQKNVVYPSRVLETWKNKANKQKTYSVILWEHVFFFLTFKVVSLKRSFLLLVRTKN